MKNSEDDERDSFQFLCCIVIEKFDSDKEDDDIDVQLDNRGQTHP